MTAALFVYAGTFMRYSLAITPKNYLLFACHLTNFGAQATQGYRYLNYWKYVAPMHIWRNSIWSHPCVFPHYYLSHTDMLFVIAGAAGKLSSPRRRSRARLLLRALLRKNFILGCTCWCSFGSLVFSLVLLRYISILYICVLPIFSSDSC